MTQQAQLPMTAEEVANAAFLLLGLRPLQSFTEIGRDEVVVASALYELMVQELQEAHPWTFCTGQQHLENDPDPPLDRYETAWHLPRFQTGTPYYIHTVRRSDIPVRYEIMAGRIYADVGKDEDPIAEYSYRVEEAWWPPSFKMAAVFRMAFMMATAVTRNAGQMKAMQDGYELQVARAKFRDSKSVTVKRMDQTRFLRNRNPLTSR